MKHMIPGKLACSTCSPYIPCISTFKILYVVHLYYVHNSLKHVFLSPEFVLQWARLAMTSLTRVTLTQTVLTTLFAVRSHKGRPASPDTNPHRLTARLQFLISIASGRSTIATATKIVKAMVPRACAVYNLDVEDTAPGKVTATTVN